MIQCRLYPERRPNMSDLSVDQFRAACGAVGPLRLTVEHDGGTDVYALPQPFALAGTDPRADMRLPDGPHPRRAAYVQVLGGRLLCLDLTRPAADRNGTYPQHNWLHWGETWLCGKVAIRLDADQPGIPAVGRPIRPDDLPPTAVEISGGISGPCQYRVKVPLILIGKSSMCQVRLRDAAVSRFHCALVHTPSGLWAVELLGRGGIMVNGTTVRCARLDEGDELLVGGFSFRPVLGAANEPVRSNELVPREPDAIATQASVPPPAPIVPNFGGDLAALTQMFAALQSQMAEHFRMTMAGMMESFMRMHDNQMRAVWEEMAHIRRLTDEVASLKATLAGLPARGEPLRPSEVVASPPAETRTAVQPAYQPASSQADRPTTPLPDPQRPPAAPRSDSTAEVDVHSWVSRRVAAVQKERDTRWQKIMNYLTGTPS
jgi:hypothetical protein